MPFLLPNQQCQSTEGKKYPLGEGCHASHQPSDASTPVHKYEKMIICSSGQCFMTENYRNRDVEYSDSSTGNCDFVSDFDTSDMVDCTADTDLTTTVIFLWNSNW